MILVSFCRPPPLLLKISLGPHPPDSAPKCQPPNFNSNSTKSQLYTSLLDAVSHFLAPFAPSRISISFYRTAHSPFLLRANSSTSLARGGLHFGPHVNVHSPAPSQNSPTPTVHWHVAIVSSCTSWWKLQGKLLTRLSTQY